MTAGEEEDSTFAKLWNPWGWASQLSVPTAIALVIIRRSYECVKTPAIEWSLETESPPDTREGHLSHAFCNVLPTPNFLLPTPYSLLLFPAYLVIGI